MPWNETTRKQYSRGSERYESDLTDAEWALLAPLLPPPSRRGRPHRVDLREVVNAIAYILWTGRSWRALPKDFPGFTTVQNYFYAWSRSGVLDRIGACFTALERRRSGRSADPSAAIIDSQSVAMLEAGEDGCGYDAGKKIKGRKRHLAVDTDCNPLVVQVHAANVQDRDGAVPLLLALQVRQAIRSTGARLWFLPPYSPDLNPIEQAFANIKHWMRNAQKRDFEDAWRPLGHLIATIEPSECQNYIRNVGHGSI